MMQMKKKSFSLLIANYLWLFWIFSLYLLIWCSMNQQSILLEWELMKINSTQVEFNILVDFYGVFFSSVVLLISSSVLSFSINYMKEEKFLSRFIILVVLFIMSMNFLIFIPNVMGLLLGWDGLGLTSFLLVIYYQNSSSLAAGMLTALANRIGDVMLLISIGWMMNQGHWNLMTMFTSNFNLMLSMTILLAAMTKSAQIPFSSWLPAAMAAPTPVSALVHSSTLVTAGIFLLIRFNLFFIQFKWFYFTALAIGTLTCLMAGACALQEFDMKKIIALSTLSQLGVMMTSLGLGMTYVAYYHMVTHALFKALLFICAGNVIHQHNSSQDIRFMGNIWYSLPMTVTCLNIANFALCGLPFLAGFYSKDLILEIFLMKDPSSIMLILMLISTVLTVMYSLRFSLFIIWGDHKKMPFFSAGDEDKNMNFSVQILTFGSIVSGAVLNWFIFPFKTMVLLTLSQKSFVFFMIILAIIYFLLMNQMLYFMSLKLTTLKAKFLLTFSTMWFMSYFFSKPSTHAGLKLSILFTVSSDQGWNEIFGGQGIMAFNSKMSLMNQKVQQNMVDLYMLLTVFFIVILMLLLM